MGKLEEKGNQKLEACTHVCGSVLFQVKKIAVCLYAFRMIQ